MSLSVNQKLIFDKCVTVLDLANAHLSDEFFYDSLPQCVIDAVFSIGVNYTGTRRTVIDYCNNVGVTRISTVFGSPSDRHTIDQLLENIRRFDVEGDCGQNRLFHNGQMTSTHSGMLKSIAVRDFATVLKNHDIQTIADLRAANSSVMDSVESDIKMIKGQSSGISYSYFLMLAGDENHMKIDRWLLRFVGEALHNSKYADVSTAYSDLLAVCDELKKTYPHLTPRLLDHTIWSYMKAVEQEEKQRKRAAGKSRR